MTQAPVVWSDAVYMETCSDSSNSKAYVLANDRGGNIVVMDAALAIAGDDDAVIATLPMGTRPVHAYGIPHVQGRGNVGEFWSHADGDGHFDVVKVGEFDALHQPEVTAFVDTPGHGKLLWDEDLWPMVSRRRAPFFPCTHQAIPSSLTLTPSRFNPSIYPSRSFSLSPFLCRVTRRTRTRATCTRSTSRRTT